MQPFIPDRRPTLPEAVADPRLVGSARAFAIEALTPDEAAAHQAEWQNLAETCLEPNVFLVPGLALPAARHQARGQAPQFLFVWQGVEDGARKLVGLCPLEPTNPRSKQPAKIWTHEQAPLGTPLLDRDCAAHALDAILAYCEAQKPQAASLLFPLLPQAGPVALLLAARAASEGRPIAMFGMHQRACLAVDLGVTQTPQAYLDSAVSSARRRKLKRARKMLEASGKLSLRVMRDVVEIEAGTEAFMALEAKGWKGRRGTAFLRSPSRAAFARQTARNLASSGHYFIVSLELDDTPIAMALMLKSNGHAYWWKIAYDEAFAPHSPGVLLSLDVTHILLSEQDITLCDSCTYSDHAMIDHIWSERMSVADVLVATDAGATHHFAKLVRREHLRRALREQAKDIVLQLRRAARSILRRLSRRKSQRPTQNHLASLAVPA